MNAMNMDTRGAIRSNAKPTQGFGKANADQPKQQEQRCNTEEGKAHEETKRRQQQEQQWQI
jgi:hypothetical protein